MTAIYRTYLACGHSYDDGEPTLTETVRCALCRATSRVESSSCVAQREDATLQARGCRDGERQ